jgi:hypothetical protein
MASFTSPLWVVLAMTRYAATCVVTNPGGGAVDANAGAISILGGRHKFTFADILQRTPHESNDVVLVSGSLIEGMGNIHSDLDVYVICDSPPSATTLSGVHNYVDTQNNKVEFIYDYLTPDGLAFHVQYFSFSELDTLAATLNHEFQTSLSTTKIKRTFLGQSLAVRNPYSDFVHRAFHAIPILNEPKWHGVRSRLDADHICYLLYRTAAGGYPEFKDIWGTWLARDYETSYRAVSEYACEQVRGLTHLCGNTNPKRKWLFYYLDALPYELKPLARRLRELLFKGCESHDDQGRAVLNFLDLIDDVWRAYRPRFDGRVGFKTFGSAISALEREFLTESAHDEQTVLEYELRRKQFGGEGRPLRHFLLPATEPCIS